MSVASEPLVRESDLLTQPEICQRFGISDRTWRRWVRSGKVEPPVSRLGHPRWRRDYVERLLGQTPRVGRNYFGSHRRTA